MSGAPVTPDGRYIVVSGRLWRRANPELPEEERQALVGRLMDGRRGVKQALATGDAQALARARQEVDAAKRARGERGPVWWEGGEDLNRHAVTGTRYADWFGTL